MFLIDSMASFAWYTGAAAPALRKLRWNLLRTFGSTEPLPGWDFASINTQFLIISPPSCPACCVIRRKMNTKCEILEQKCETFEQDNGFI